MGVGVLAIQNLHLDVYSSTVVFCNLLRPHWHTLCSIFVVYRDSLLSSMRSQPSATLYW